MGIPLYPPNLLPIAVPVLLWLMSGPFYIGFLKRKMLSQYIREDGPQHHQSKAGTPTMGGLLIIVSALLSLVGFILMHHVAFTPALIWVLVILLVFGLLGFSDDWIKITKKNNKGLTGWSKLAMQVAAGGALGLWMVYAQHHTSISFFGHGTLNLGWFYPIFAILVVTGASNAYNLADGLDGLAGGTGFFTFLGFFFLLSGYPELQLLSLILTGACLGFLTFNRYPAKIFMGDTGSLALGGVMGALAIVGKIELFLLLLGGVYVFEALSVMLQVSYFKWTKGKRLFKMSPLHHHFELSGWSEQTVVLIFVLAQLCFSVGAVLLAHFTLQ